MNKKAPCIMLIDDNADDNFFHERVIRKSNLAEKIIVKELAQDALDYLVRSKKADEPYPDLIFLDINMPRMNGWEFLEAYAALKKHYESNVVIVILTTSENPDDYRKAMDQEIAIEFCNKPLTKEILANLIDKYF
jgi:response regulator RpfG family c-di-GMP phosphodiesterase